MNTRKQVSASRQVSEVPMCISRKRTVFFFFFPYLNGGTLRCGCIQVCSRANYRWLRVVLTAFLNDEWLRFFVCLFISILSSLQLWFSSFSLPCELSRVLLARSSHYGVEVFYNAPDTTHKLLWLLDSAHYLVHLLSVVVSYVLLALYFFFCFFFCFLSSSFIVMVFFFVTSLACFYSTQH